MRKLLALLERLWANWITLLGTAITTLAGCGLLVAILLELVAERSNPYRSGLLIVFLPLLFLIGLAIIPLGLYVERRRSRRPAVRGRVLLVLGLTGINVALLSVGGHDAVVYMDSPRFCGTACHTQMQPQWTAYQRSPHNRVACVECHIGPGTGALVSAKLNGLRQLLGTVSGHHHRPVPSPVAHRPGAAATCEGCHARSLYIGDRLRLSPHYKTDKDNTPAFNVLLSHVGGRDPRTGRYTGIHAHMADNRRLRYAYLDAQRTRIGDITVFEDGKVKAVYKRSGAAAQDHALGERDMDCIDCHNRPTHRFDGTARQAVERALFEGRLDAKQPYLAKVATAVLTQADVAHEAAAAHFQQALPAAYAAIEVKPSPAAMEQAARAVTEIYLRNIFPQMKVGWSTYPDLAGHYSETTDSVGCFRCHDGNHQAQLPNGRKKTIDKSCDLCHDQLATEKPPEKFDDELKQVLGLPLD